MSFKKKLLFVLFSLLIFSFFSISTEVKAEGDPLGFTVETMMPDTQIDENQPYFYIETKPKQTQKLKVKVSGNSEEPVKVKSYVTNAFTTELGTINYLPDVKKDETLVNSIEEIATVSDPEFTIKKGEEKIVTIEINTPSESFDGIKLGSVYFSRVDESEEEQTSAIKSAYSYRIGIMLSESVEEYSNGATLNLISAKPELLRKRKSIILNLQNPEPKMIADFSMKVQIINESNGKVVKTHQLDDGALAPNSNFNFAVDWGIQPIPSGKYIAKVDAKSRYDSWKLEKKFEITAQQAKKLNEETLVKLTLPKWAQPTIIGLGSTTVLITIALVIRSSRWKKQTKNRGRNRGRNKNRKRGSK